MIHSIITSPTAPHSGGSCLTWPLREVRSIASRVRRTLRAEVGNTMVEFALASTILISLVFGVIAVCLALYTYNGIAEASREATRYAMVRGSKCTSFATACPATSGDILTYVKSLHFLGITPASVSLPQSCCWPTNNNPGSTVKVTVQYTFPLTIPFVPSQTLSMSSTSQMVISQ